MEMVQAVLILAGVLALGLVVLAVITQRRLAKVQSALEMLEQLPVMAERLDVLSERVERREFSAALSAKLTEVNESHARLEASVAALAQYVAGDVDEEDEDEADDLGTVVHRHLSRQGFDPIRILTDLGKLDDRSGRVVFEARRLGATHKGHLVLQDGEVVDEEMRSAYSAFP
jgi:predicted signal transduction protein with EAL and GGDEF domain